MILIMAENPTNYMTDREWKIGKLYIRLQLSKPYLVKKWCFIKRNNGAWNLHLFPVHFHYN